MFDSQFDPMKHGYFEIGPICISDADTHTIRPDTYPIRQISFYYFQFLCYDASGLRQGYKKDTAGISEAPFLSYFGILGGYFAFVFSLL